MGWGVVGDERGDGADFKKKGESRREASTEDVGEDGGDKEGGVGDGLATDKDLSAFGNCVLDVLLNFLHGTVVNQRPMCSEKGLQ